VHSRVGHQEFIKEPTKEQIVALVQQNRQTTKPALYACLQEALAKSNTVREFLTHVEAAGCHPYHRGEKLQGVIDGNGMKFRFSWLGVQDSIEELQARSMAEEQALLEIHRVRKGKEKVTKKEILAPGQKMTVNNAERKLLDEVSAIRAATQSREYTQEQLERFPTLFDGLSESSAKMQEDNEQHPLYND
jgi:hypothetical protein